MARIIYGVAGEGFGHSSRSHLIGQRLIESGHDVMFAGCRKSLKYLRQYFGDRVKEVFGLSFVFNNGRIDKTATARHNFLSLPECVKTNEKVFKQHFEPFKPDLVFTDFEPFTAWWAWKNQVPLISVDHQHVLTLGELDHIRNTTFTYLNAKAIVECFNPGPACYLILNFFDVPLKVANAVLAPPIVRPAVAEVRAVEHDHIVVYWTTAEKEEQLRQVLTAFEDHRFFVYGFNKSDRHKNMIYKETSTRGFLADLASSKGVIASAGFSLISECLYLRKRMLLKPIPGQFEQIMNAYYVEKLGLGVSAKTLDRPTVAGFLERLEKPFPQDSGILWPDNTKFFEAMQKVLSKLDNPISIRLD